MGMMENTGPGDSVKLGSYRLPLPRSRLLRIVIGVLLVLFGLFGFLPVLGFWMVPLGLLVLSIDIPRVRRWRRRFAVWFSRRYPATRRKARHARQRQRQRQRRPSRPRAEPPKPLARRAAFSIMGFALVPRRRETRLGIKWECGEEGPKPGFQFRSCPRNCERRAHPHVSHRKREGAGEGTDPRARRPARARSAQPAVGGTARRFS